MGMLWVARENRNEEIEDCWEDGKSARRLILHLILLATPLKPHSLSPVDNLSHAESMALQSYPQTH